MVGIFTGADFGLGRGSASTLGAPGLLGDASQGGARDQISVNAATGNLLIQKQDEFLVGRGPDASVSRSYNSLTTLQDDNNDRWRQSTDRRVTNLTGTVNAAGSTVARVSGDGSYLTYVWDAGRSAYLNQDGGGAYDTITRNGNEWVWTDGDTRTVERYADDAAGRIKSVTDHVGTTMAFAYDAGGRLYTVTTSDGSWIRYDWVGSTQNVAQIVNGFTDFSNNVARTITRTRYGYDAANRLTTVTVDLSPQNNSISDGKTYVTTYGYDAGGRVSSIAQSDGSAMSVAYDASGRVVTLVQTASSSITRTTSLAYNSGYTLVTDATGQVTRLDYNGTGDLTKITAPPAAGGVAAQVWQFAYNAAGDVTSTTDPLGQATTYADFTANGVAQTVTDRTGATTTRTFDAANHLLSETRSGIDATGASVQQTTRYVYNAAGDLRFVITPAGLVTEYVRNGYGAITSEIRYSEGVYDTAGTPTEAVMAGWAAGAWDKSGVQRTDHMYDARLQRIRSTSYATASADGAGQTTDIAGEVNYIYDQAGNLLWTQAPGRGQTTYVYDGLGRMTATSDAAGQWTSLSINDAANRTAVMVADGTTTIRTYNRAGDLLQEAASGANATTTTTYYAVDKLGRRRITSFSAVPRPSVSRPSIARMPVAKGCAGVTRSSTRGASTGAPSCPAMSPPPSSGRPSASIARPAKPSPTIASRPAPHASTRSPTQSRSTDANGDSSTRPSAILTTCARTRRAGSSPIQQCAPTGASGPSASTSPERRRRTRPCTGNGSKRAMTAGRSRIGRLPDQERAQPCVSGGRVDRDTPQPKLDERGPGPHGAVRHDPRARCQAVERRPGRILGRHPQFHDSLAVDAGQPPRHDIGQESLVLGAHGEQFPHRQRRHLPRASIDLRAPPRRKGGAGSLQRILQQGIAARVIGDMVACGILARAPLGRRQFLPPARAHRVALAAQGGDLLHQPRDGALLLARRRGDGRHHGRRDHGGRRHGKARLPRYGGAMFDEHGHARPHTAPVRRCHRDMPGGAGSGTTAVCDRAAARIAAAARGVTPSPPSASTARSGCDSSPAVSALTSRPTSVASASSSAASTTARSPSGIAASCRTISARVASSAMRLALLCRQAGAQRVREAGKRNPTPAIGPAAITPPRARQRDSGHGDRQRPVRRPRYRRRRRHRPIGPRDHPVARDRRGRRARRPRQNPDEEDDTIATLRVEADHVADQREQFGPKLVVQRRRRDEADVDRHVRPGPRRHRGRCVGHVVG
ncbi:MAG: hypothetical protein PGN23_13255 [Sphingomonas adhaesiva]